MRRSGVDFPNPRVRNRPITEVPILRQPRHAARHRVRRGRRGRIV
jgi:hypothetical protein